ncbi:lipase foldase protein [Alcanivorax nanhaiticus]|uniref:Lipase chaperone n=1 Tax=Alcanivorax nanhaiticus TaxID=1177154 RepID=A0A095SNS1_9GAMM|nr:lipase secretion chaperone [Alcanivorax nanhaiticus]KGD66316.1 lipase foldase protein [Alcanivorax nanhaiticus]
MKKYLALSSIVLISLVAIIIELKKPDSATSSLSYPESDEIREGRSPTTGSQRVVQESAQDEASTISVNRILATTSLADTQVPAKLNIDRQGHLIVDSNSKAILDYFLSLSGEIPEQQIRSLLQQWASGTAGETAARELTTLHDSYQHYLRAFSSGDFAATNDSNIRDQLQRRQRLRDDILGADHASSFFADEDRYDQYSLQRHDILASELSDQEKELALTTLRQTQPEHLARQYQQQHQLRTLQKSEQALIESGGDETDLFALHQEQFGDAAALRLQQLSRQRNNWKRKVDDYQQQRQKIQMSGLSDQDQQQQLEQLRSTLFNEAEQQRISALERIQSSP